MKKILLTTTILLFVLIAYAQIVNIPDANFKAVLIGNPSINTNMDTEIQVSEANSFTGELILTSQNISDLTGIEAFTSAWALNCEDNQLTSLDVSNNAALISLTCGLNSLTSLIFGNNTSLTLIDCVENQISSLNVSSCIILEDLYCSMNSLTSLILNDSIKFVWCNSNQLTSLDLSNNVKLQNLRCSYNNLTQLNIKNGNNSNITSFSSYSNPDLYCIQVDDSIWSTTHWTMIDTWTSFSENCLNWIEVDAGNDINSYCGGNANLDPIIVYNGPNILTYSWSPSTGLSSTIIPNPIANPSVTTTYTISVTDGVFSALDSVTVIVDPLPLQEICMVTVDSVYGKNKIVWEKEQLPIVEYYIWKETIIAGTYNLIDVVPYSAAGTYVDMASDPNVQSDKYKISVLDSCGYISDQSPYHKTIHLNVSPAVPNGFNLTWEHYEGYSFSTYTIYRKHNNNPYDSLTSIAYNPGVFTYTDLNPPGGNISYFIAARKPTPCDTNLVGAKLLGEPYSQSLSNIEDNLFVSITEFNDSKCKIFPNPSSGKIYIEAEGIIKIEIMDLQGKVVYTGKEKEIDLSQKPKGIYIIKVTTNLGVAVDKIVLE